MDHITSPPTSPSPPPSNHAQRPSLASALRTPRSGSRLSMRQGSTRSDEDSKTAVKVAVRVRPPLQPSDPGFDLIPQRFRAPTCQVSTSTNLSIQSPQGKKLFVFDRVFDETTTQQGVWDYVSDSVHSFVQGYNVSILAYGQSGAGKSYTMGTDGSGDGHNPLDAGIVPRAATALFDKLNGAPASSSPSTPNKSGLRSPQRYSIPAMSSFSSLQRQASSEKTWTLKATYVEIYNETLRDLLLPASTTDAERPQVSIREDTKGRIIPTGLTHLTINSVDDLLHALSFGSGIRQTDATAINAKSSRSHAVFSLNLIQKKTPSVSRRASVQIDASTGIDPTVTTDSKLHFVDLAGSERLKNTGAQGDRAKEGISINAGLASLGKVISQLSSAKQGAHISYRDSRLTRLLQDSLGGNAITYMVACVNPAEFHLSETLNTITYAQRARAIQSKPEIQQQTDEADKASIIARLQAEVAFLRDQLNKNSEKSEHRMLAAGDHKDRRESELQNQLMDMQENYTTLSQRHAKLISEISRAREDSSHDTPTLRDAVGESAMERIKRSNSFNEAVEQVVMEYEKTIQSLETSLSNNRSMLSASESSFMELEARYAYMESQNNQLQSRLHKSNEREANNDAYLRELETQIESASSSEEKSASLVSSLRKELSRVKDAESTSEEYISTLEEKLAEAEQDREIMKRELDRLENVIERQRSIGRLDNLLAELDTIRQSEKDGAKPKVNGNGVEKSQHDLLMYQQEPSAKPNLQDGEETPSVADQQATSRAVPSSEADTQPESIADEEQRKREAHQSAQSKFMADKLETITQELFDLQSEHEATVTDYDALHRKYQNALQTIAKLQEAHEEDQVRPGSRSSDRAGTFLEGAGVITTKGDGRQESSSRSLESELSSHQQRESSSTSSTRETSDISGSPSGKTTENDDDASTIVDEADLPLRADERALAHEMELLRQLHVQREASLKEISENYARLSDEHKSALGQVEDLKLEVQRAQLASRQQQSPSLVKSPMMRRKPSQDLMSSPTSSDRAMRSFASLRNIALDNFEFNIDVRQNFELHLNTIMSDLHDRAERLRAMETEVNVVRKDLENKTAIVAGLSRERASMQTTPNVDFTVVGHMRDQLMESEQQIKTLRESHDAREVELQTQIKDLHSQLDQQRTSTESDAVAGSERLHDEEQSRDSPENDRISHLEKQLSEWQSKHSDTTASMKGSEAKLLATIATLEASLSAAQKSNASRDIEFDAQRKQDTVVSEAAAASLEKERSQHREIVETLQKQIDDYRSASQDHNEKLSQLQQSYSNISQQVEEDSKAKHLNEKELQTHRDLISNLETQLGVHKSAIGLHEQNIETLKTSHQEELINVRSALSAAEQESNEKHVALEQQHKSTIATIQQDLKRSQEDLEELLAEASSILGHETDVGRFHSHLNDFVKQNRAMAGNDVVDEASQQELATALNKVTSLEAELAQLKTSNQELVVNMEKAAEGERKSAALVQELEDQLNSTFDEHQATTTRLSAIQNERNSQLEEAQSAKNAIKKELEDARLKVSLLESQLAEVQRRSLASTSRESMGYNTRESLSPEAAAYALARSRSQDSLGMRPKSNLTVSTSGLPSPPPAIPLPPIPTPGLGMGSFSPTMQASSSAPMGLGIDARTSSPIPHMSINATSPPGTPHHTSQPSLPSNNQTTPTQQQAATRPDSSHLHLLEEQESRIRTIEKHLFAEKQLTATLEEALVDLETSQNKTRQDLEAWRKKCQGLEEELQGMKKERHSSSRASMQQVEEEREMRVRAERARQALEERMRELNKGKKKGLLNCF